MAALPKLATASVLFHVASNNPEHNYASAICRALDLKSGTVVPVLNRSADRDGVLQRQEQPTSTGRPRLLYSLTASGQQQVSDLWALFEPRMRTISGYAGNVDAATNEEVGRINTSTIWLLAAAAESKGSTFGYTESMRPMTHQVAYVELQKLTDRGWFVAEGPEHAVTASGRRVMRAIGDSWLPVLNKAAVRLQPGNPTSSVNDD